MLILVKIIFFMIDYSLLKPKWNYDTDHCSRLKYSFRTTLCCPRYGHKFMFSLKGKVRILLVIVVHIFQNAQVTWNKMVHKKRHHFLAQFSISFHIVWFVLLRVLAPERPYGWLKFFGSQSEASIQWFFKLTLSTKQSTPSERVWKTVTENAVFSCVPFCFRSLGHFARCAVSS